MPSGPKASWPADFNWALPIVMLAELAAKATAPARQRMASPGNDFQIFDAFTF
jgi:hypothetical protein